MPKTWDESDGFRKALAYTLEIEGGWSNDPDDRGGKTNFGVTEKVWRDWCIIEKLPYKPIESITVADAEALYKGLYWDVCRCGQLESARVAMEVFEIAVNCGVARAGELLQKSVNLLHPDGTVLKVDGVIGRYTLSAANSLIPKYEVALIGSLNVFQGMWYIGIQERNPSQRKFIRGWMKRCVAE